MRGWVGRAGAVGAAAVLLVGSAVAGGPVFDCNGNGVEDATDIQQGTSLDCDANGVPDECDLANAANCRFAPIVVDSTIPAPDETFIGPPDDSFAGLGSQTITFGFDCGVLVDGPGGDLVVYERDSTSVEFDAIDDVLVSQDGVNFVSVVTTADAAPDIPGDTAHGSSRFARSYDLAGSGLVSASFVRIVGASGAGTGGGAVGFDLDAVGAVHLLDRDCDDDGLLDSCVPLADCDADGLADVCQLLSVADADCDGNGQPDACDVAADPTSDCDADGRPDSCQADCNANGIADSCDISSGSLDDCDGDGIGDACEIAGGGVMRETGPASPLSFGLPLNLDLVGLSPATGPVTIQIEARGNYAGQSEFIDVSLNGMPIGTVFEGSGSGNNCDLSIGSLQVDANTFNMLLSSTGLQLTLEPTSAVDSFTCPFADALVRLSYDAQSDCDANGKIDLCDVIDDGATDCDMNLVPDVCEADCNANSVADACDIADLTSDDCDANGVPDECQADCNSNGLPDSCDIADLTSTDCNDNAVPDECDLANGSSEDCDGDALPDECPQCGQVEVVFVVDTSPSIQNEGAVLCDRIADLVAELQADQINVTAELLSIVATGTGTFSCLTDSVLNVYGDMVPGSPPANVAVLAENCDAQSDDEDWGRAVAIVAGARNWLPNSTRLIVPIFDEGPWCGDPISDPGVDREAINQAILNARAAEVTVSPVLGDGSSGTLTAIADDLALATGGQSFQSSEPADDLLAGLRGVIDNACDLATDCNSNDIPDACELAEATVDDCNLNAIPDVCEPDCNGNGIADSCDLDSQQSSDVNGNQLPDECEELTLVLDGTDLLWTEVVDAIEYDVVQGELGLLRGSNGDFATATSSCFADGTVLTQADDGGDPALGQGFWYLVRVTLGGGALSYDSDAPPH